MTIWLTTLVQLVITSLITSSIQPFYEISKDSTGFPAYGEFRSFAFGGILAVLICCVDSSHVLSLLNETGCRKSRVSALIDNGSWFATTLALVVFEIFRISGTIIDKN